MSGLDHRLEPEGEIRRFEVINGAMGRRRWSADDRARILEETLAPGAVVSAVARRHGLTPQQLFTWRREARKRAEADAKRWPSCRRWSRQSRRRAEGAEAAAGEASCGRDGEQRRSRSKPRASR